MASIKSNTHQEWILYTYKLGGSPISNAIHWTPNAERSWGLGWKSLISYQCHATSEPEYNRNLGKGSCTLMDRQG